ncbi:DUF2304 domain-containing protein [Aestuariibacter salexigens]|uniref:DUF2304 domain-containing protein n=1 Tax=Aestuariibacter salexigens TaxID=226010 RepID=UPI000684818C|nr:DUF2304 domain-containing protein [Aestuariibacter salexigens]
MSNVNLISAFIGAVLSVTIVFLTRRDHISPVVAARWFAVALLVLFVSFFPGTIDWVGKTLGIGYPPIIAILVALGAALIKILLMDIERQKLQTKLDRVVQRLAILEGMMESERKVVKARFNDQRESQSPKVNQHND